MNRAARIAAGVIALLGAVAAAPAGPEDDPASYALRATVTPVPGALLQRIDLPAAILAAARTPNLADLRLFNAAGRAVPIARAAPASAPPQAHPLRPLPILAPAADLRVTGLSLRLDTAGQPRLATVSGTSVGKDRAVTAGYLFDARHVTGTPIRLTIDADLPAGQPVTLTVEAGATLGDWRTIGERIVYREPGTAAAAIALPLSGTTGAGYLRIGWRTDGRLLAPVTIRGATLLIRGDSAAAASVDAVAPAAGPATAIEFVAPFAVPIASITVSPRGGEALVPIRIAGRDDREHAWVTLGHGIAGSGDPIAIAPGTPRILRIEAEGAGFSVPPAIRFGLSPRALLFLAAGPGPYTLAVGRATTPASTLPAATLAAGQGPAAQATIAAPAPRIHLVAPNKRAEQTRTILLWSMLLAATAALAGLAWLVWRRSPPATPAEIVPPEE